MYKQFFCHYELWEDFINGMYNTSANDEVFLTSKCKELLSDQELFFDTLKNVTKDWPSATKVNLTNNQQNKRAWLGAAACSYKYNAPEYITRLAWNKLTKIEQMKANLIAMKIINKFNQIDDGKTLFGY